MNEKLSSVPTTSEPVTDDEVRQFGYEPTEDGWMPKAVEPLPRNIGNGSSAEPLHSPPKVPATVPPPSLEPPGIAHDQRVLDAFKAAIRRCGVVGEERVATTVYLAMTSRLLPNPVSIVVKGTSSSGKSFTVETTSRFFPPSAFIELTAMSERALVYMEDDYKHRSLILYEAVALREGVENNLTAYFVRSLLSEGRVNYPVTVRNKDGNWTTKTITKEGPTNLIMTTTATQLHGENETRLISVPTNDTPEQTKEVLRRLAQEDSEGADLSPWRQLQTWLEGAEHRVTIPFAGYLAEQIPPVAVRLRRDFGAILNLIRAHAILHQLNRERDARGWIVAAEEDYQVVRDLVADLVSYGVGATVSPTMRETVECVRGLQEQSPGGVQAVAVGQKLGLDKSASRRRLVAAREAGYLENLEPRRGRPGRYVVGEPMPDEVELLPPRLQEQDETAGQTHGGTVASRSQGDMYERSHGH